MDKYEIIIYWSDDDQAFIAEAPELPGCMETAKEFNDHIPVPQGRRLAFA